MTFTFILFVLTTGFLLGIFATCYLLYRHVNNKSGGAVKHAFVDAAQLLGIPFEKDKDDTYVL